MSWLDGKSNHHGTDVISSNAIVTIKKIITYNKSNVALNTMSPQQIEKKDVKSNMYVALFFKISYSKYHPCLKSQ